MCRIEQVVVLVSLAAGGCSLLTNLDGLRGPSSGSDSGGGAPAYVQGKTLHDISAAQVDWSDSMVLPQVRAGDALVVGVLGFQAGPPVTAMTVTDNRGDTFTATNIVPYDGYPNALVACAFGVAGGDTTISIVITGPKVEGTDSVALEYTGVSALDAWAGRGGGTSGPDGMASGPATTSASDLIVGIGYSSGNSVTAGSGFTARDGDMHLLSEDRLATAAGSQAATETMTSTTDYWVMMMVALK
jgi:hypothetical protein